eukprot:20742_2
MRSRASVEGLSIDESGIAALAEIGSQTSLRYVGQLLTPARVLAVTNGTDVISKSEIDEVAAMFIDAKRSAVILQENADKFISTSEAYELAREQAGLCCVLMCVALFLYTIVSLFTCIFVLSCCNCSKYRILRVKLGRVCRLFQVTRRDMHVLSNILRSLFFTMVTHRQSTYMFRHRLLQ